MSGATSACPLGLAPPDRSPYSRARARSTRTCGRSSLRLRRRRRALLPLVVRREPHVAVRGPLLERVHDPVGLVEPLARARLHVRRRLLMLPEPCRVRRVEVDVRLAVHHPLGERLSHPGPSLIRRRRPTRALHLGQLAEDRHPSGVRRGSVDRVLDAHRLVADDRGHRSSTCSICRLNPPWVNGNSVGERDASSTRAVLGS